MKALTICQPYAELIVRGLKPIENRTWPTSYRGPLLIHAGKSREWMDADDLDAYPGMVFGALVGRVNVVDCVRVEKLPPHSTVILATPVIREVPRRLLPSTSAEITRTRSAVLNLFILDTILARLRIVKDKYDSH